MSYQEECITIPSSVTENRQWMSNQEYTKLCSVGFDVHLSIIEKKTNNYRTNNLHDDARMDTAVEILQISLKLAKSSFLLSKEPFDIKWSNFESSCLEAIKRSLNVLQHHIGWNQILINFFSAFVSNNRAQ